MQFLAPEMQEKLDKARQDGVPQVAAWATFQAAQIAEPAARAAVLAPLSKSPEPEVRMLALLASEVLDPAARRQVVAELSKDADPVVQDAAEAKLELLARPAAPRPAANPAAPTSRPSPETAGRPGGSQAAPDRAATAPTTRPGSADDPDARPR